MTQQEPEEVTNNEAELETVEIEDVETLKQALAEEKRKAEDYLANWQRAQADFINYKRRTELERQDFNRFANANLILSLLPALDDLERALSSIPPKLAKHSWVDGIRLVERKFKSSLETQGLTPIKALGEPFDPNFHEALRQDKGKEGIIVEEFQKGYMLGDRVLRPAKVVVGNGEEEEKED
ncbi:MAG: nucleotide exchange factor GrpE [Dehalococcoidales bacterium]|nr:nucleotide exchange factor GrpE [Dehalococcoidales bacterium]